MTRFRLVRTSTARIFTIQIAVYSDDAADPVEASAEAVAAPRWINRATLALDPELTPEQIQRWAAYVQASLNSSAWTRPA